MKLITGGTGFIGQALVNAMVGDGEIVNVAVRQTVKTAFPAVRQFEVGDIGDATDWRLALKGVQAVIHTAARVHVMHEDATNPLQLFRAVNTEGTLNLARQAAESGVRRFVFVSSIKVNGEITSPGIPFTPDDIFLPSDPYGLSKHEAEIGLRELSARTGLEVVIVRPPLVYGSGVKANFAAMIRWLNRGWPLPLGAVTRNRRSLVALDNLVDFLMLCSTHPAAANQIFMVSDGEDVSTADLLRRLGVALDKPAKLLSVPTWLLRSAAVAMGKGAVAQRLLDSLQVDISKNTALLGWSPRISVDEGLRRAVCDFI